MPALIRKATRAAALAAGMAAFGCLWLARPAPAQKAPPGLYHSLQYRYVGPQGNRVVAVAGVPGNANVFYAGAATGGVWKTEDGGVHWKPIFDGETVASIGAVAVAPSDPNIVWVGTGEAFIRGNISIGDGTYKSIDAGKTWTHMGLDQTGRIAKIIIDPHDPNLVYAASLGHCYGPQQERGVFRTTDGGKSWQRVLFVDENTGASDLAIDSRNPRILFAGMWQVLIRPWDLDSGGPGSGVYMSSDAGTTWKHLTGHGLPESPLGRIGLAVAPSDPSRVYALIETGGNNGSLWRSDDGGDNWNRVSQDRTLNRRPHYYSRLGVEPDDPNQIWILTQLELHMSIDGGATAKEVAAVWPDNHDIWIDPLNPNEIVIGNDRYVNISTNRGRTWMRSALPIAQIYHVSTDDRIPYWVYGNRQDGPSHGGPSNSLDGAQILPADWVWSGGAESGWTFPDPADPNFVWINGSGGFLEHLDLRTGLSRQVDPWPDHGWPPADRKFRFQWTFPMALSPHNPHRLYAGSQYLMESEDAGQSWKVISPDLTRNDKSKQQSSGGLSPDNTGVEVYDVLFAIAESPVDENVIWAGSNDGLVHVTRDGGRNWTNVTGNMTGLPPWGAVTSIDPSPYSAGAAYATVDLHQMNDRNPYVYKTGDYGATWQSIASDLPRGLFGTAQCILADPVRKGLLYLGIENGIYISLDDGGHWAPFQQNLPRSRVSWITIQPRFRDLVVSTYGRGIWILDDVAPLEQMTDRIRQSKAYLLPPRPAYRFLTRPGLPMYMGEPNDPPTLAGKNPPYGAVIDYYLASEPAGDVQIEIYDAGGRLIRTMKGAKDAGINRVWWDLKYDFSKVPRLLTSPEGLAVSLGPDGTRPFPLGRGLAPLVAPGKYTLKMKVAGSQLSGELEVLKDPNSGGSVEGIQSQTKVVLELRDAMNTMAAMIDLIEAARKQAADLAPALVGDARWKPLAGEADDLGRKLLEIEATLFDPHITGRGDTFYYPPRLYSKVESLARDIASSDYQPTAADLQVAALLAQQVAEQKSKLDALLKSDVAAFNQRLRSAGVPAVGLPLPVK